MTVNNNTTLPTISSVVSHYYDVLRFEPDYKFTQQIIDQLNREFLINKTLLPNMISTCTDLTGLLKTYNKPMTPITNEQMDKACNLYFKTVEIPKLYKIYYQLPNADPTFKTLLDDVFWNSRYFHSDSPKSFVKAISNQEECVNICRNICEKKLEIVKLQTDPNSITKEYMKQAIEIRNIAIILAGAIVLGCSYASAKHNMKKALFWGFVSGIPIAYYAMMNNVSWKLVNY
jgi:hypothetical protein